MISTVLCLFCVKDSSRSGQGDVWIRSYQSSWNKQPTFARHSSSYIVQRRVKQKSICCCSKHQQQKSCPCMNPCPHDYGQLRSSSLCNLLFMRLLGKRVMVCYVYSCNEVTFAHRILGAAQSETLSIMKNHAMSEAALSVDLTSANLSRAAAGSQTSVRHSLLQHVTWE